MMFNVVIIDDESTMLHLMKTMIDWKKESCCLTGEACDGTGGLELIEQVKPDIIITDIEMPSTDIDGLKMIREALRIVPEAKIIILTCHKKFEYIEEALKLGVIDYLLKPCQLGVLTDILRKAVMELKYTAKRKEKLMELNEHFSRTLPLLQEKLLYDIIYGIASQKEEIESDLEHYKIFINDFLLVLVEINDRGGKKIPNYNKQLYKIGMINFFIEKFEENYSIHTVSLSQNRLLVLIDQHNANLDFENDVSKKVADLQELIKSFFNVNITAALSTRGKGWEDLALKVQECLEAIEYKFYMGEGVLIHYADLALESPAENITILERLGKDLTSVIRLGDEDRAVSILEEINMFLDQHNCDIKVIRNYYVKLIYEIYYFLRIRDDSENDWDPGRLYRELEQSGRITDFQVILQELVVSLVRKSRHQKNDRIMITIKRALDYIDKNHHCQELDLKEVAENSFVCPTYLSRILSKETGKTYVEHLHMTRIKYAKEYLVDSALQVQEISQNVGFSDPHYFSRVFRKYTKMTPVEYRTSHTDN